MGPTQNWPLLILLHGVSECPSWKGPGSSASQARVRRQETGTRGLRSVPVPAEPRTDPGLGLRAPEARGAPPGSHLRQSQTRPGRAGDTLWHRSPAPSYSGTAGVLSRWFI